MIVRALTGASGPVFFADEFDAFQLKVGDVTTSCCSSGSEKDRATIESNRFWWSLSDSWRSSGNAEVKSPIKAFMRRISCKVAAPQKRISSNANLRNSSHVGCGITDPEGPLAVSNHADLQTPAVDPQQRIFNLVKGLNSVRDHLSPERAFSSQYPLADG